MIVLIIFVAVGVAFVIAGASARSSTRRFEARAERTTGEIVELRRRAGRRIGTSGSSPAPMITPDGPQTPPGGSLGPGPSPIFHPVVAFTTADGREMRVESALGTNPPIGRVGEHLGVLYDPSDPADFRLDTRAGRQGWVGTLFMALGALVVVIAVVILVVAS